MEREGRGGTKVSVGAMRSAQNSNAGTVVPLPLFVAYGARKNQMRVQTVSLSHGMRGALKSNAGIKYLSLSS